MLVRRHYDLPTHRFHNDFLREIWAERLMADCRVLFEGRVVGPSAGADRSAVFCRNLANCRGQL